MRIDRQLLCQNYQPKGVPMNSDIVTLFCEIDDLRPGLRDEF